MHEITKAENQRPKTKDRIVWLLLFAAFTAIYFFGLTIPLVGPDEPRYAQVAQEMFERNDWITPTLGGANWFEKPALLYWLQIVSYNIFGISEFAARFGSAVFGLLTVISLWVLGRSLETELTEKHREIKNKKNFSISSVNSVAKEDFANWLALTAASSIGLIVFSHGASFDIILTFPITASLVAFFIFDQSSKKTSFTFHFSLFTFHFFIGISLLAKGLIGIVFPFAIVAFYYLLSRKFPTKTFLFSLIWGMILSLVVASVWYLPMYLTHGWTFVDEFFIQHHFARYTSNKYQHPQPFWFFFGVLPLMTIPWLPFFLASVWDFVKVQSSKFKVQSQSSVLPFSTSPLVLFALSWLIVPLVFFSFSGSKLPGYILPALPAALILTAECVSRFVEKSRKRRIFLQGLAFLTFAIVAVVLQFVAPKYAYQDSTKGLIETARAQGYEDEKVINLHTISHNAEFYAAGRLIRDENGKLKKFLGVGEVVEEIKRAGGKDVLVLVPLEYLHELPESPIVESKIIDRNGELAIVLVKEKQN